MTFERKVYWMLKWLGIYWREIDGDGHAWRRDDHEMEWYSWEHYFRCRGWVENDPKYVRFTHPHS